MVDCMVALPSQLFYSTMIPSCLWFLSKNKENRKDKNVPPQLAGVGTVPPETKTTPEGKEIL